MIRDRRARRALIAGILTALIALASAAAAQAATINVTTFGDPTGAGDCLSTDASCSLRQAINAEDETSGGDTIELGSGTYTLTQGSDLEISGSVTIEGAGVGTTTVDGSQNWGSNPGDTARIFRTDSPASVKFQDLTLTGGDDRRDELTCSGPCETVSLNGGGALWNNGATVVVDRVAFANNPGYPIGGGISNSGGNLSMTDVSFTNDQAAIGGALFTHSGTVTGTGVTFEDDATGCCNIGAVYLLAGTVSFTNTTVVGSGGPSSIGGGIHNTGATLTLTNDTLSGNLRGQLQTDQGATTNVANTIIGNGFSDGDGDCIAPGRPDGAIDRNAGTAITNDLGHNIDQDGSCDLQALGDVSNVDPKLASIADNGGPTPTQALVYGSPAFGAANESYCPSTDQRGVSRDNPCDIGAFEAPSADQGEPSANTEGAQNVQQTQADLNAQVNFAGEAGGIHFTWGTSSDALTNVTDETGEGKLSTPTTVSQTLGGLSPGTKYYYAAVADNASGTATGATMQFTTPPGAPTVYYGGLGSVTDTTATIDFTIDPQGADTTYVVKYGTDGYTQETDPKDIGSTAGPQDLSATLSGLTPGTTYHFDVVATNSEAPDGVDSGDQTLTTDQQVTGTAGSPVTVTDSGTSYDCPSQATIDWGDGSTSQGQISSCSNGQDDEIDYQATATHVYAQAGDYEVQIEYPDLDAVDDQYAHIAEGQVNTPGITQSPVSAGFYASNATNANSDNPGDFFDDWTGPALWTQTFPIINFDDDASQDPPGFCPAPNGDSTLPFTDGVSLNPPDNTNCDYIVAQNSDGSQQAGVDTSSNSNGANLYQFTSVMTGNYTVDGPGQVTFNSYSDDGFSFGIGPSADNQQPVYTSGSNDMPSGNTAVHNYDIVGSDEGGHPPYGDTFTVYFPAAGTYPFELDYDECCGGTLEMTLSVGGTVLQAPSSPSTGSTGSVSNQPPSTPGAPAVIGGAPTSLTINGASVSGTVNPEGAATQAYFQYGLDPSERGPGSSSTLYNQSTPPQGVGSDSVNHTVNGSLTGLIAGALYHVRLVATNNAGTTYGPDETFTAKAAAAPPPPVLGKSEDAKPVSGRVFIRSANGQFIPLTGAVRVTSGTVIDALHGSLQLLAAVGKGKTEHGIFGGAIFRVTQAGAGANRGLTTLAILEGLFKGAPSYALCKAHKAGDASAASLSSKTLQLLHSSAHGKFRTSGRYSAATVRGTIWTVADRCNGTFTHDVTDSVAVTDFVHHKTIILHAGQSYLARRP